MAKKAEIEKIDKAIKKEEAWLAKHIKNEAQVRERWAQWNKQYIKAVAEQNLIIAAVKNSGSIYRITTKKFDKIRKVIKAWSGISIRLTQQRDEFRSNIKASEQNIAELKLRRSMTISRVEIERNEIDEIVSTVFALKKGEAASREQVNDYLTDKIYGRMEKSDGRLRSQLTLDNSAGTLRVKAMVNTIQFVDSELAEQAMKEIEKFFERLRPVAEMDENTNILFDLTEKLLVEKARFKIGPDLYRFLSLKLYKKDFPELYQAQLLLKSSLRSEKSRTYIRLYEKDRAGGWRQI